MIIRRAQKKDIPSIYKLVMSGFDKYVVPTIKPEGAKTFRKFNTLETMIERFDNPKRVMFVAEENKTIKGYIEGNKNNVGLFFVRPNLIGKGIGKILFKKFEDYIKRKGGKYIHVNASLSAVDAYNNFGFKKITGIRSKDGVVYQPMKKSFN